MKNLDDAVERMWDVSRQLMVQDFKRIEAQKRLRKSILAAPLGKENSTYARGMIYAFLKHEEYHAHLKKAERVKLLGQYMSIFDTLFPHELSRFLDDDSDRACVIAPDKEHNYRLTLNGILLDKTEEARARVRALFDDAFEEFEDLKELHGDGDFLFAKKEGGVLPALLDDAYTGHESTRIQTGLEYGLGLQRPIIIVKTSPPEQPEWDVKRWKKDSMTGEQRSVTYSRLGTGQILLFGPEGLERRGLLRINTDAEKGYHLGTVLARKRGPELPVVFEEYTYEFNPKERRVEKTGTTLISNKTLHLYELKR